MAFTSPGKLGEALRQTSPWFWTLAIVAIVSVIVFLLIPADIFQAAVEAQARARGQDVQDPGAALRIARIGGAAGALLGTFVAAFVIAGVLYLAFNVMFGQDTTYKQHLSAAAHMYWINLVGFLVVVPIWISRGDMTTQLGFGLLLQDAPETFVGHFLNSITIFGLWAAAALGAMESGVSGGRIPPGKAIATVLVLYFIFVLFSAARATLFGI
ncbi:MAG: YIP1 family protein [Gemmatimonadota bacterium]|nr:MAG: YIP1 family protein [Gemmatimonadota bacterium]